MSADGSFILPPAIRKKPMKLADLFCGAGGFTTGAVRAARQLGLKVEVTAVNHWDIAIQTHTRNHPEAVHFQADLEHLRPIEAIPGGFLDLLMAAPACTFHSRARGGKPVNDQQRMDPWHVVRWCTELRVKRILVENVPEFVKWGPCDVRTGKPIKSRQGEYFRAWVAALQAVGFKVDWKVDVCCADYGDPTTRVRFLLIGRSDGKALRWPNQSHTKGGSTDLLGTRAAWRGATEIIDWSMRGKSIFGRKKPLAENTLRRLLAGAKRNNWPAAHIRALEALLAGEEPVLDVPAAEASPFLLHLRGTSDAAINGTARDIGSPVPALTTGSHVGLVMATGSTGAARPLTDPVPAITGGGPAGFAPHYLEPSIIVHRCNSDGGRGSRSVQEPMPTACTSGAGYLAQPLVAPYYGGGSGLTAKGSDQPLDAITTKARFGVAEPVLMRASHGDSDGRDPASRVLDPGQPLPAQTGSTEFAVAEPFVMRAGHGGDALKNPAAHVLKPGAPLPAQTGGGEFSLAQAFLVPNFGERAGQEPRTHDVESPLPAVTATGHIQLAQATVIQTDQTGEGRGGSIRSEAEPLHTIVSKQNHGLAQPFILPATHHGDTRTRSIDEPLPTITGAHRGELAMGAVAEGGRIDILYRMLHWSELSRATSFEDEGETYEFAGNATEITKQIGNAVPGRTSKAHVMALLAV
ncbi:MAG: DNA cytosine methyltransferase [Stagnimonas sp.]|nr:DNA cytosine methyltransferase [Stagnimonas sp.]